MSEKRAGISIYLTPRAANILRDYNESSGYGSISRTVEEMILAFDAVYKNIALLNKTTQSMDIKLSKASKEEKTGMVFLALYSILLNIDNAVSRLKSSSASDIQK